MKVQVCHAVSLFTNVPLEKMIDICADVLYHNHLSTHQFPDNILKELMLFATKGVKFNFSNIMYSQIYDAVIGSPLSPVLANIFLGFHENWLFQSDQILTLYYWHVDDTFVMFSDEHEAIKFFDQLESLHLSLSFIMA